MAGQPNIVPPIPRETVRSAKAVFGPSNFYIQVGERLKVILEEIQLECFAEEARNSMAGGAVLPLVTFFEFVEGLTDSQAADALRTRIDWKYALHLPINLATLRPRVLCEFRRKVFTDPVSQGELQKLVDRLIVCKGSPRKLRDFGYLAGDLFTQPPVLGSRGHVSGAWGLSE